MSESFETAGGGGPNGGMGRSSRGRSWVKKAAPPDARGTRHVEDVDVLPLVVVGVRDRLRIDPKAKRAIEAQPDGHLAILTLEYHECARRRANAHPHTPLSAWYIRCVCERIGHPVGRDRAYRISLILRTAGLLTNAGICVPKKPTKPLLRLFEIRARFKRWQPTTADARVQSPVPDPKLVKGEQTLRWWQHALFGSPDGLPPPGITRERLARMKSYDERHPRSREAAA